MMVMRDGVSFAKRLNFLSRLQENTRVHVTSSFDTTDVEMYSCMDDGCNRRSTVG